MAHGAAEDIELAVAAARRAFDDQRSDWRRMTPSERGKLIHRIGDLIEQHADELAELEALDNGKPVTIARGRRALPDLFRYMLAGRRRSRATPLPISAVTSPARSFSPTRAANRSASLGDHPLELPAADGGLEARPGAGGRLHVVLKPAEETPLSALRLGELMWRPALPDGVVNIVTGFGETGRSARRPSRVDKVAFTGSTEVGKLIVQAAAGISRRSRSSWAASAGRLQGCRHGARDPRRGPASSSIGPVLHRGLASYVERESMTRWSRRSPTRPGRSRSVTALEPRFADGPAGLRRAVTRRSAATCLGLLTPEPSVRRRQSDG